MPTHHGLVYTDRFDVNGLAVTITGKPDDVGGYAYVAASADKTITRHVEPPEGYDPQSIAFSDAEKRKVLQQLEEQIKSGEISLSAG